MSARFRDLPVDDSAEAARARVDRSRVIHERGHRFVLLVEEAVLHYRIGDADAMAAQLGHLLTAGALPAVSLGIIPSTAHREQWPRETFHVYDNSLVSVELVSARVRITQPSEIALYAKSFEELRQTAVYGAAAQGPHREGHRLPRMTSQSWRNGPTAVAASCIRSGRAVRATARCSGVVGIRQA